MSRRNYRHHLADSRLGVLRNVHSQPPGPVVSVTAVLMVQRYFHALRRVFLSLTLYATLHIKTAVRLHGHKRQQNATMPGKLKPHKKRSQN